MYWGQQNEQIITDESLDIDYDVDHKLIDQNQDELEMKKSVIDRFYESTN